MATKSNNADSMRDSTTDRESEQAIIKLGKMPTHINLQSRNNAKKEFQTEDRGNQINTVETPHDKYEGVVTRDEMEDMNALKIQDLKQPGSPVNVASFESKPRTYARPDEKKQTKHSEYVTQEISKPTVGVSQNKDQQQTSSKSIAMNTTKSITHAQNFEEDSEHIGNQPREEEPTAVNRNGQQQTNGSGRIASSSPEASIDIESDSITSEESPLPLRILVMNAYGKKDNGGSIPKRRRQTIQNIVVKYKPDVVFFQEFVWSGIRSKKWSAYPLPEQYNYTGHNESSLMIDSNLFPNVDTLPAVDLEKILENLQSNQNNRLQTPFPTDFNPISRMCARVISTAAQPSLKLLCISWHGPSNRKKRRGPMPKLVKIEKFKYLMEFFRNVREKFKLPMLVAGDFNVDMDEIEEFIEDPFKLCKYKGSERRKRLIDFCIFTDDLEMGHTNWINLNRDSAAKKPNKIFDHDPIFTTVSSIMYI